MLIAKPLKDPLRGMPLRFAVQIEGVSQREAARRFGIDPRTVAKMIPSMIPVKGSSFCSLSLVRYRGTDYSVPTAYGHAAGFLFRRYRTARSLQ